MNTDTCFIVNTRSGGQAGGEIARRLPALMAVHNRRCEVRAVHKGSRVGRETERALQSGFRTIVAAGGDGTISTVASHLAGSDRQLGILPLGTFNYVAREFGIPLDVEDAIGVIANGREKLVDVGEVNGRAFLNNAGLGGYVKIVRRRERVFASWGRSRIAAYWVILRSLFELRKSLSLKVTVDGQVSRHRTPMIFAAKSAYQLEQYNLAGAACVARRQLALFVAPDCNRWELIRLAFGLALGRLQPERDFALYCGSDILVETSRRSRHVICDGEIERLRAPFRFGLRKDALRLLAPASGNAYPDAALLISDAAMDGRGNV
jgi:diacylglycerol kinase family enzyme